MIHIWLWNFPLPPFLSFLPAPYGWALATLAAWLVIALVVQFVLFRIIRILVRRTESDVEDVVLDVTRRPLVVVILLLGLVDSLKAVELEIDLPWVETAGRWLMASVIAVSVKPGQTAFTLIPYLASSSAALFVKPSTPAFAAA